MRPLISCLCPTKNHPKVVIEAIIDFKQQSYANKELILVTDEKSEYIEFLKYFECENIKLFLAPHGSTIGALRNITMDKNMKLTIKELLEYLYENQINIDNEVKDDKKAMELWKNIDTLISNLENEIGGNYAN